MAHNILSLSDSYENEAWFDMPLDMLPPILALHVSLEKPNPKAICNLQNAADHCRRITEVCIIIREMPDPVVETIYKILENNKVTSFEILYDNSPRSILYQAKMIDIMKRTLTRFKLGTRPGAENLDAYSPILDTLTVLNNLVLTGETMPNFTASLMKLSVLLGLFLDYRLDKPRAFFAYVATCNLVKLYISYVKHADCALLIESVAKNTSLTDIDIATVTNYPLNTVLWTSLGPLLSVFKGSPKRRLQIKGLFHPDIFIKPTAIEEVLRTKIGNSKLVLELRTSTGSSIHKDIGTTLRRHFPIIICGAGDGTGTSAANKVKLSALEGAEHIVFTNYTFDLPNPFEILPKSTRTLKLLNTVFQ